MRYHTIDEATIGLPEKLASGSAPAGGHVRCRRFLGGLLRDYYRVAA
jgi:hypothetical protein